jgi:trimeric autotransporter adhesin
VGGSGGTGGSGGGTSTDGGAGTGGGSGFQLTVTRLGSGSGDVVSSPAAIDCGTTCSHSYSGAVSVTLNATPKPGSLFSGWGGACAGTTRSCTLIVDTAKEVTATFNTQVNNVVFVTSTTYRGDLGGLAGADQKCATLASAAGLTGTYQAWLSTSTTKAASRLAGARGWTRVDGAPVADLVTDLVPDNRILNPISLDETEKPWGGQSVNTGTDRSGNATTGNCLDWTLAADSSEAGSGVPVGVGRTDGGPNSWTYYATCVGGCCSAPSLIYCFGIDKSVPLVFPTSTGKRAFVTSQSHSGNLGGVTGADSICAQEATNAGLSGTFRALLATTTASAASRFTVASQYVRPDGQVIATGSALFSGDAPRSGIWQTASGSYVGGLLVWTGAASIIQPGTVDSTCGDWLSTSSTAGRYGSESRLLSWWSSSTGGCATSRGQYCIED